MSLPITGGLAQFAFTPKSNTSCLGHLLGIAGEFFGGEQNIPPEIGTVLKNHKRARLTPTRLRRQLTDMARDEVSRDAFGVADALVAAGFPQREPARRVVSSLFALGPKAPKKDTVLTAHGHVRHDPYYWLRERDNPEVLAHLAAENAHFKRTLAHTKGLQDELFNEMQGRIKPDDSTVPYREGDYYYYDRFVADQEYPIHCRKKFSLAADEEIILDVNELARGCEYFEVGDFKVSPDENILAYAVHTTGRSIFELRFKDLKTGRVLADTIPNVTDNFAWASDSQTLFYAAKDPQTLRSHKIFKHKLGEVNDDLVFGEDDDTFHVSITRTRTGDYLVISSQSTLTTEVRILDANHPDKGLTVIKERARAHKYDIDHGGAVFYIRTNDGAKNFRLMQVDSLNPQASEWREVIPHREDVLLEDMVVLKDYVVLKCGKDGLSYLEILDRKTGELSSLAMNAAVYVVELEKNRVYDTDRVRFSFESLATPTTVFDYHLKTKRKEVLKEQEVGGGFNSEDYTTERIMASSADGTPIPMSIVYRKGLKKHGQNPALLYGYGAYGDSSPPYFNSNHLSLLDRGFVVVIAHIRGGSEMGRDWYENGRMLKKQNSFDDFLACSRALIDLGFTSPQGLFAMGESAGGLLMGAVVNRQPALYRGVIADVPFVDAVTTMLDETIPLTTTEYDEWGNPHDPEIYRYILEYSPYDNVRALPYPAILALTGLNDTLVQYWEPAKWVAMLREHTTSGHQVLLKVDRNAGHDGPSGRFEAVREVAMKYAFLLSLLA